VSIPLAIEASISIPWRPQARPRANRIPTKSSKNKSKIAVKNGLISKSL
jgi:hypothetical protein